MTDKPIPYMATRADGSRIWSGLSSAESIARNSFYGKLDPEAFTLRPYQVTLLDALESGAPIVVKANGQDHSKNHAIQAGVYEVTGDVTVRFFDPELCKAITQTGQDNLSKLMRWLVGVGEFDPNDPHDAWATPHHRPSEPSHGAAWYRGWECGYDESHSYWTAHGYVAYRGGCDLDACTLTSATWRGLFDVIDEEEDE